MNDSAPRLEVAIVEGIDKIPRAAWDALLAPDDSPFVEWDWLYAMEHSGSAAPRHRMGPVSSRGSRGAPQANRRRGPALPQDPQHGRVRLRPWMGRRGRARRDPLLPQDSGRRAVHAAYRTPISNRAGVGSSRPHQSARPRAHLHLRGQQAVECARQFLPARRSCRARADRIHGAARLSVPLA